MGITFTATIERTGRGGPRTIALIVEGSVTPPTPPRRHGHPDTWDDGDPGQAVVERVTLRGTEGGCILRRLTDAEIAELELGLVEAAAEEAERADEARADYLADCAADDTLWDEVPV